MNEANCSVIDESKGDVGKEYTEKKKHLILASMSKLLTSM